MNKKGFTLVEVTISIALLAVVMAFMLKFLTLIRKDEDSVGINTNMLLNKSVISKALNEDFISSNGIDTITCTTTVCNITFNNGKEKTLTLEEYQSEDETTHIKLNYLNVTDDKLELAKELDKDFIYQFVLTETENIKRLKIEVPLHKEYDIKIIDYKTD